MSKEGRGTTLSCPPRSGDHVDLGWHLASWVRLNGCKCLVCFLVLHIAIWLSKCGFRPTVRVAYEVLETAAFYRTFVLSNMLQHNMECLGFPNRQAKFQQIWQFRSLNAFILKYGVGKPAKFCQTVACAKVTIKVGLYWVRIQTSFFHMRSKSEIHIIIPVILFISQNFALSVVFACRVEYATCRWQLTIH